MYNLQQFKPSFLGKVHNAARGMVGRASVMFSTVMAALTVAFLAPFAAFAASDPGAAITAEITSAKTTITGILVVLAGIVGLFILWAYLKRAR